MEGLNVVSIACPRGQFSAPAYCDPGAYCLKSATAALEQQQPGNQLLEQLQDCNARAQRLLTLLSIHREQGIGSHAAGLDRLFSEALACIVHALQAAAAAKQPLLTASSQHSSCFCKLLERLHLLDALWKASNPGPTPGAQADEQLNPTEIVPEASQEPVQCPALPFINQLESALRGTSGLDTVLAALIAHAQQNAAVGSKLAPGALAPASSKQEVLEVSCLSAVQEHHSSARALPLLIRLYFNTGSRAETIAAGRPEPLTAKLLERSLAVLASKPVVLGCADVPVCLTSGLQACQGLSELAAGRKLKLPTELGKLDFKAAFKLDQSYSLQDKVLPLLQQHDELCDLLSQLALEIQQAVAVERDIDPKALDGAEQLVAGSLSFAAAARNSLLDLDAWRLSTCGAGTDSATPTSARACQGQGVLEGFPAMEGGDVDSTCDRYKLKDEDVVPFMDVLGAVKGLTGLLVDSSTWLQPLLHEHAVAQLNDLAFRTLPQLSKLYARNPRLQDLLRAIYACMQGQPVQVGEDVDAAAVPSPAAAAPDVALAVAASDGQLMWQAGRPLGEGFEGLKERWGSLKGSARRKAQKAVAANAAAADEAVPGSPPAVEAAWPADLTGTADPQAALTEPADGDAAEGIAAAEVAAHAAADVQAATVAAEAAAAAMSAASSPRSVSQVEVAEAEEQAAVQQGQEGSSSAQAGTSRGSSSGSGALPAANAPAEAAAASGAVVEAAAAGEASAAELISTPAQEASSAKAQLAAPGQPASRKRTLKGLFKFATKTSGRKRDKASAQPADAATAAAAAGLEAARAAAAAEFEGSATADPAVEDPTATAADLTAAAADGQSPEPAAKEDSPSPPLQPGSRPGSAKARRQQQQVPPCLASAWTDSQNDMPLCNIRPNEASTLPSATSSMTDLNSAGFERPPDLPWELQGAAADMGSEDSPRSVARAAAMFERIAAANRHLAAAQPRLSSAGRQVAGGSKSSPGGWEAAAPAVMAARLSEVAADSCPISREQLLAAGDAECDAEQHPGEPACDDSPLAASVTQQPDADTAASPAKAAKRRPGLFGFRSLRHGRAAAPGELQQQGQQPGSAQEEGADAAAVAAEEKQLAVLQQEKALLAEQLQDKQLEVEDESCAMDGMAIPASWDPAPVTPKEGSSKHEGRMKGMLSLMLRGSARAASAGAVAVLQGDAATPSTAVAVAAVTEQQQQLAELGGIVPGAAAAEECGADGGAAAGDVPGSPRGSQPDASEDSDEDQPAKTRRVMGLMNRIRVFTQGAKEQHGPQPAAQQQPHTQQQQAPQPAADTAGNRQGLKGLTFTAKLKKAMGDRRQSRFADTVGADGQTQLPLECMPSAACLQLLQVLLELLMAEIKAETKKHLMMQLQMAAAAAAGSAGVSKPDASIARPLKQVKQVIKAVHRMQLMLEFPRQLAAAADLSDLWLGASCGSNLAAMAAAAAAPQQGQQPPHAAGRGACPAAGSATKHPKGPELSASVDMSPPSPKGLHPWSLSNLLFEENSENLLNEGVRNSLGALSLSRANRNLDAAAADSPRVQQQGPAAATGSTAASSPGKDSSSPTVLPYISSFPSALVAACVQHLERMPAELPLMALQVLWDARRLLNGCGLLGQGLGLLQEQERLVTCCYMQHLVPTAYEHFKRIAGHQTITVELLQSCKAAPLQPVQQLYFDSILREPCTLVMQADYTAVAAEAMATLQPGKLAELDKQLTETLGDLADTQQVLQQQKAADQVQQAVETLQRAEQEAALAEEAQQASLGLLQERPLQDQQDPADGAVRFSGVFEATKPGLSKGAAAAAAAAAAGSPGVKAADSSRTGRKKRHGNRPPQLRASAAGLRAAAAGGAAAEPSSCKQTEQQPAGVTPLMQKLESMEAAHKAEAAAERCKERRCLREWGACELDVRQWLLAGMLQSLEQDTALVVAHCSDEQPAAVVKSQLQAAVLQRTHALMAQYTPLPQTWDQVWQQADALQGDAGDIGSITATAAVSGLLRMLDTAVYDAESQLLLPAAADNDAATGAGNLGVDGVLAEVEAVVQPLQAFFGRQHLAALQAFTGPLGVQHLIEGVLGKLGQEQVLLLEELLSLQQQLPPSLLQMPPAEQCRSAGEVLQFYQVQLSNALEDHAACAAALASLQRIGNCLALLHLVSMQQAVQATPTFMQVAPLLGIVGRPLTDAAAAAECFEGEDLPAPPPAVASAAMVASGCQHLGKACTPGLLMPEVEALLPSDHTRHTHKMQNLKELHQEDVVRWEARQAGLSPDSVLAKPGGDLARHRVWQASHFQRLLLGPDAEKVRGPGMLLTQTAELRAWRATEGVDMLGPCMERMQVWAVQLQQLLQGEWLPARRSKGRRASGRSKRAAGEGAAAEGSHQPRRHKHRPKQEQPGPGAAWQGKDTAAALRVSAATAAPDVKSPTVEPSAESFGHMTDRTQTDGDLSEVEHQLQSLQAQVNAALIAAEERLRVVSMSPPQALLTEVEPRMQLPPAPIPFSLTQGAAVSGVCAATLQQQDSAATGDERPAAALEAEDAVQQASPRGGSTFSSGAPAAAPGPPESEASGATGSSSSSLSTVPALLSEQELAAAAEAAAAAAAEDGFSDPWEAADLAAAQTTPGSVPPSQAKLAYKLLTQPATASPHDAAADSNQQGDSGRPRPSSGRTGLAGLVEELSDVSGGLASRPGTQRAEDQHDSHQQSGSSCKHAAADDGQKGGSSAVSSPRGQQPSSPTRAIFVSCPGRCESLEDDATSESDARQQSPQSPWQGRASRLRSPAHAPASPKSPQQQRSPFAEAEGEASDLMAAPTSGDGARWEGDGSRSPDSRDPSGEGGGSPMRYPTPPITELLYETTCDELVRVKDERDILRSEVEVLRNQLKNRDSTLAMLSGQMLITPRTSAADCESLMRAAMSECSVGSLAMQRSQPAASGLPSHPSNTISIGNSTNGTIAMRRAASNTPLASAEGSAAAAAAAAARAPRVQSSGQQGQQQAAGRPVSAGHPGGDETSVPASSEPSKSSVRVHQATPCANVSTVDGGESGADQATCSSSNSGAESGAGGGSTRSAADDAGSSSSGSYTDSSSDDDDDDDDDDECRGLAEACLISTAGCGTSRKLKMPQTVKAARRSGSSSNAAGDNNPSPWPPAQLAVTLSALKFVLLIDVAMAEDGAPAGVAGQDVQGLLAGGVTAQSSPLKRLRRAVEGVAAAAAAAEQQAAVGAAGSKQRAITRGSGRMTTAQYGDGPLLAAAVLLQLSGQARRFEVLDATGRIAHWVEYDAVKASSSSNSSGGCGSVIGADAAAGDAAPAGVVSPRGAAAAGSIAPSGVAAIVGAPGGVGAAADGIAAPKPRSKKRQEEEAEALARERAAAAAQQQLLERLAAAHRQAARVSRDGSSLAARLAPPAPARSQRVRLRVFRVDGAAVQQLRSAAGWAPLVASSGGGSCSSPGRITFGGGGFSAGPAAAGSVSHSGGGSADNPKVPAVPVRATTVHFAPRQQPWAGVRPTPRPIQAHPSLPMPRPQPLLLTRGGPGGPARGGGVAEAGFVSAAVAGLPREAAAAAAAAGTGIVGPSGKLLTGASVAPRAGLVAAARVMAAREVLLQAVPRNAAYSFSVVSDQNRSGRPEDGYSMAPSSDLDSIGSESPRRSPHRPSLMSAAVGASAARLGGRQRADGSAGAAHMEQWLAGTGATEGASSPTKSAARSPPARQQQGSSSGGLLARAFGQQS